MMDIDFQNKGIIDFDEAYSEMMNLIFNLIPSVRFCSNKRN